MPTKPKPIRPYWNPAKPQHVRSWDNPWYNTKRWQKVSKQVRYLDYPICKSPKLCINFALCGNLCTTADHIIPVSSGATDQEKERLMWAEDNHQPMCDKCHAKKSQSEK